MYVQSFYWKPIWFTKRCFFEFLKINVIYFIKLLKVKNCFFNEQKSQHYLLVGVANYPEVIALLIAKSAFLPRWLLTHLKQNNRLNALFYKWNLLRLMESDCSILEKSSCSMMLLKCSIRWLNQGFVVDRKRELNMRSK